MAKGYSTVIRAYVKETLRCAIERSWLVLSASGTFFHASRGGFGFERAKLGLKFFPR